MNLSGRSVIAGVGESEQVRRPTRSVPHMCIEAALLALEDAGLSPRDVDAIITDDEMAPSVMVGSEMAAALDIDLRGPIREGVMAQLEALRRGD